MRSSIAVVVVNRPKEDQVLQSRTAAATSWLEGSVESVTRQARLRSAGRVGVCVSVCVCDGGPVRRLSESEQHVPSAEDIGP